MTGVGAGVGPWFGAVADAFRRTFEEPGEEAAAGTVFRGGTKVVDLWAGVDVVKPAPDAPRELMMIASCSTGTTATVVAMLVERGLLDPGERVAAYSPEFAANGKEQATIEMVAGPHGRAALPATWHRLQGLDEHRREAVTKALAAAPPLWAPGTAMAYHPITYGTLLDEIVRRATGVSVAHHVQTLIAEPLDVDMWMGLPEQLISRVVPGLWEATSPTLRVARALRRRAPRHRRDHRRSGSRNHLRSLADRGRRRQVDEPRHPRPSDPPTHR